MVVGLVMSALLSSMAFSARSPSGSRFNGKPLRHIGHKPYRLALASLESFRGKIRGAASREWLLHPSPAKSAQRRIRKRLLVAYERRFGADTFSQRFNLHRMPSRPRSNWLSGGYAWWRERLLNRRGTASEWPVGQTAAQYGET